MRVLYDVRPLQQASAAMRGIGSVVRGQLGGIGEVGSEHEFALLRWAGPPEPQLELPPSLRWRWLEVERRWPRQAGWFLDRLMLPRVLAGQAEVAHFLNPFDLDMGWAVEPATGMRTVVTVHDLVPVSNPELCLRGRLRLVRPFFRRMASWLAEATVLACNSHATAVQLREWFGRDLPQVRVVPLGIDDVFRLHSPQETLSLCKRLALEVPFLLYVGGLGANKNLVALVRALRHVPEIPLLVIATSGGVGPEHPLRMEIAACGLEERVRFVVGLPSPELACLYSAARLFVLPSLWEGFGLPVVEAMASGTPVACASIPALCESSGGHAVLFDPNDEGDMRTAINQAWSDESRRAALREQGLERAACLRWRNVVGPLQDVYRSLG